MGTQLPQFLAYICCGQTAGWIKMPLDREVGLVAGNIVLDGDPAPPPPKGHSLPPNFGPCLLWPNGRPPQLLLSTCLVDESLACHVTNSVSSEGNKLDHMVKQNCDLFVP